MYVILRLRVIKGEIFMAKRIVKWVVIVVVVLVLAFLIFLGVMTGMEYDPQPIETLEVTGAAEKGIAVGESLSVMSFNIGYASLGKEQDFFMDGGDMVRPDSIEAVEQNLDGIVNVLKENPVDVYFLQEADIDSKRSYNINEVERISNSVATTSAFVYNYNSAFVPYPVPPIGKVESGLLTLSSFEPSQAARVALPVPFKWPVRLFNLKRCLLFERIPLDDGHDLILVNLHLEAYDDGEGKAAQTKELMDLLQKEYNDGNYIIAGGDFNQMFPGMEYPVVDTENWVPGALEESMLPEGWQFAADGSTPTCRLLNGPFSGDYSTTQLYVIDGYILSPNVQLDSVKTLDLAFEYSDHHPVILDATLVPTE